MRLSGHAQNFLIRDLVEKKKQYKQFFPSYEVFLHKKKTVNQFLLVWCYLFVGLS